MKKVLNILIVAVTFAFFGVIGGIEANTITLQNGMRWSLLCIVAFGFLSWISGAWRIDNG